MGKLKNIPAEETKNIKVDPPPDYDKYKPVFSFLYMDYGGKTCLSKCQKKSKASFADTLLKLSQRTWEQILSTSRKSLGRETISVDQFKVPMPSFVTPDVKKLTVFRFSGAERMAGIRQKNIFHVLLIGKDLYNH